MRYAQKAVNILKHGTDVLAMAICEQLKHDMDLTLHVINQTEKRVIHGQSVHASERIVSIFEPHADIIVKDRRDTFYDQKVCLTGGASNLIMDRIITDGRSIWGEPRILPEEILYLWQAASEAPRPEYGNPADVSLTEKMLDRPLSKPQYSFILTSLI